MIKFFPGITDKNIREFDEYKENPSEVGKKVIEKGKKK